MLEARRSTKDILKYVGGPLYNFDAVFCLPRAINLDKLNLLVVFGCFVAEKV
jgi:hypothetical protein